MVIILFLSVWRICVIKGSGKENNFIGLYKYYLLFFVGEVYGVEDIILVGIRLLIGFMRVIKYIISL